MRARNSAANTPSLRGAEKIALVQTVFPVYRTELLKEIAKRVSSLVLVSDPETRTTLKKIADLEGLTSDKTIHQRKTRHHWIKGFLWEEGLIRVLLTERPTAIILQGSIQFLSSWCVIALFRVLGIKVFLWTHGALGSEDFIKMKLRKLMMSLSNGVMLYGDHARRILISQGVRPEKLHTVFNSLSIPSSWTELRENMTFNESLRSELFPKSPYSPIIIFVGRVQVEKRLDLILDCVARSIQAGHPLNFLCVGIGDDISRLKPIVKQYGIDNHVNFYGETFNEEEIRALFLQSAVCVSPGSVGLTAIHALSCGVPVITHNRFEIQGPEFEAVCPGVTGDFYTYNDTASLFSFVSKWTSQSVDRIATAQKCWRIVAEIYSPDKQAERMLTVMRGS